MSDPRSAPLGITLGDAAGVGPELVLTCAAAAAPAVVYGSTAVLRAALESLRGRWEALPREVVAIAAPEDVATVPPDCVAVLDVLDAVDIPLDPYPWGQPVAAFGHLQHAALVRAIADARAGHIAGIVTAPWHKARLRDAGLPPTGHTEVLEALSGADRAVMVLAGETLRVALATVHLPIAEVPRALTPAAILEVTRIFAAGLRDRYRIASPRIALCGLNPHAGEDGVMGTEEQTVIAPAIATLRAEGIDADGPFPADTLFPRVAGGDAAFDGIVAMYHDQGLAPLKTFHFGEAANITFGLPFVRTSVDHGTAYDIAGTGRVRTGSFRYAARLARQLAGA